VVCGVITRLYKFLLLDYYEEFRLATQSWVSTRLAIVRGDQVRAEAIQSLEGLVALYTERVLPRELLRWWNNGLDSMQHRLAMEDEPRFDADPAGFRAYIVGEIAEALRKHCLVVDEHPTLSRFFTFIEHINRLLLMDFLQMGPHAILLTTINPQVRNKGRMAQVLKFFKMEGGGQYLRRTSLCLQLTGMATSITAKKSAPDAVPLLVRLFEGEVIVKTQVHLSHLLTELWRDPTLDAGACISAMLLTVCDIVLRFRVFLGYPYRLCSLCRRFNPEYLVACMHFLRAEDSALDVGLSIPLRKLARAQGDELLQIRFLTSDAVQGALEDLFDGASGSTLEVERKHVETKRNETSRLSHVAVASRNQILRWFHRRAQQIGANIRRATRDHAKALATNVWSPAWKRCDDYRPRPPGCTATARGDGSKPCTLAQQGDTAARNQFVHEHNAELSAELGAKRAAAKAALELARSSIRATSAEWLEWMRANMTEGASFRAKMRTSTK
jgi:hypothetical protein